MNRHTDLRGKRALLVGATGSLGKELAVLLAAQKCRLALVARDAERLRSLQGSLKECDSAWWSCDITASAGVFRTYREIVERFGGIDVAVLAAGVGPRMDAFGFSSSVFEEALRVNLLACGYWLECLIPEMVRRRSGMLVGVSSLAADRGLPMGLAYCPGKAGLSVLFESLRTDLSPLGIRVHLVEPGFFTGPMAQAVPHTPFIIPARRAAEEVINGIVRGRPVIRFPLKARITMTLLRLLPRRAFDAIMGADHPVRVVQAP